MNKENKSKEYKIVSIDNNDVERDTIDYILKMYGGFIYHYKEEALIELNNLNQLVYEKLCFEYNFHLKRRNYLKLISIKL